VWKFDNDVDNANWTGDKSTKKTNPIDERPTLLPS